ncbi:hypothetical protein [Pseudomonas sp. 44 R 15]|nr:hypothetical protein [Pseudomonas sp. 44 R 15]
MFGGDEVHVTPGLDAGVGAALEYTAGAVDVATGLQGQAVGGFDARGVVDEVGAFGAVAAAALVAGDGAFVEHIAIYCAHADVAPADDAAGAVGEAVAGQQVETVARCDEATVDHVAPGAGSQVLGGAQGADVGEVGAADQAQVAAGDQRAIGRQAVVGLGQVEHRHQHLLAGDGGVFHPHDVVGQGRDLFGGEAYTHRQIERLTAADGVVHQVLEHRRVAGLAVDEALAGAGNDRLLDQALFIEAVAQAFLRLVGVVAEFGQHVIGTEELAEIGQLRVGFDQVFLWVGDELAVRQALHAVEGDTVGRGAGGGYNRPGSRGSVYTAAAQGPALRAGTGRRTGALAAEAEQAALAGGQGKAGQAQRVDLLLGQVWRQLRVEGDAGRVTVGGAGAGRAGGGFCTRPDVGVTRAHYAVVDTGLRLDVHRAASLNHGSVTLIIAGDFGDFAELGALDFHHADEVGHRGLKAAEVIGVVTGAFVPVFIGECGGCIEPASRVLGAL